jgi:5-hydroxyisourate hydrolase
MNSSRGNPSHSAEPIEPTVQLTGRLTTHVLDVSIGKPAAGVRIVLRRRDSTAAGALANIVTGTDGRCPAPLLEGAGMVAGRYVLTFHVGEYFRHRGVELPEPAFLEEAVVYLGIASPEEHYHVPLLIAPWSYTVYRGG